MDSTRGYYRSDSPQRCGNCCMCRGGVCGHSGPCSDCSGQYFSAVPSAKKSRIGWICPACGAGLSPFVTICPNDHSQGEEDV